MSSFINYFLQTVIAISVFYILYWLLLRKETFFRFNRYYFLVSVVIALIIPFLNIGNLLVFKDSTPVQAISGGYVYLQNVVLDNALVYQNEIIEKPVFMEYIVGIYLIGVIVLLFRLIFQTGFLFYKIQRARVIRMFGSRIVLDEKVSSPFSFFSWIFLNLSQIRGGNISEIIQHEKEHIRHKHSFDLFLIELLSAFQWVNPFVWFLRKSVKETHEYLADHAVLKQGVPVNDYQKLLLSYVMGAGHPALITPLNYSLNKKRMIMMKKMKSPSSRKWRSLLLFPVVLFLSLAFSNPFSGGSSYQDKKGSPESYLVKGKVTAEDSNNPLAGASVIIKEARTGTITDSNGEFILEIDVENAMLSISFKGYETHVIQVKSDKYLNIVLKPGTNKEELSSLEKMSVAQLSSIGAGLYIIDGKEVLKEDVDKYVNDPDIIQSMSVLKGETAVEKYGEKGRNGVVLITIKGISTGLRVTESANLWKKIPSVDLYILDGKEISINSFKSIDPESIKSVEVQKGEDAVKIYGEKAQNGVIIIKSKEISTESIIQKYEVGGKVVNDETGQPLPGVSIVIMHTAIGTVADINGKFLLEINKEAVQVSFSYVGFETQIVNVKDGDKLEVKLKKGVTILNLDSPTTRSFEISEQPDTPTENNTSGEIFFVVEDMPYFPGGKGALSEYISSQINYPEKAKKNNISGTVYVNFTVDEEGNVKNVYVDKSKSVDPDLDKEAIRVISGMPKWEPGEQRGKAVPIELSVPVDFSL